MAVLLHPTYVKAYVRRSTAYERTNDRTKEALRDAKTTLSLEEKEWGSSNNIQVLRQCVTQLQKMEDKRLEKLKTETFDKLKDLGNSILGNF